ncbi:hypothetical protein [Coleofasciculus sp. FACHB-1120]|uniref:hypothetical protein n=1 Tax=Coleofasciculus sp. FACHB-1120 TaxID=2692783 RepID=UPI0016891C34|nr:hypothetical protein [Coleofasciculus sp. FACHB-1120]
MYNSSESSPISTGTNFDTQSGWLFSNPMQISRRSRRLLFCAFLLLGFVGCVFGIFLGSGLGIGKAVLAFIVLWAALCSFSAR